MPQQEAPIRLATGQAEERPTGSLSGVGTAVLALLGLGLLLVAFDGERSALELPAAPPVVTAPTIPVTAAAAAASDSGFLRIERPPLDHDPLVVGAPGPGVPLLAAESDLSVLYINSIGRPTLINLDTGARREVDVSPLRPTDSFLIEEGEIVAEGRLYLGDEIATARAIRVFFERPVAGTNLSPPSTGAGLGPRLCLTAGGCFQTRWTQETLSDGTDTVATLDPVRHPDIAQLFDPTVWVREGRWLLAPETLGLEVRIPAPMPGTVLWVIHQPGGK